MPRNAKKCYSNKGHYAPKHLSCSTGVDTTLKYKPSVRTKNFCKRGTSFDIVLDLCAKPTCHLRQNCNKRTLGSCKQQCSFTVDLDCPFTCDPHIVRCGGNPHASFDLEVDIETESTCKARPHCNKKSGGKRY